MPLHMARLFPCMPHTRVANAGYFREMDVLERLQQSLPAGYEIFHNVDWHSLHEGEDRHGEIDLVVMNLAGDLLLVEVKAGQVAFQADGIFKTYGTKTKQVDRQLKVQYSAMLNRLDHAGIKTSVNNCLVLPDCLVLNGDIVAIPRERIFDADDYEHLGYKIQQRLPLSVPNNIADQVRRFLSNLLNIAPDVSALQRQIMANSKILADGLATWVPRISSPSGVIRIQATAGSGKTQLALRLLSDAHVQQKRALYVCYNRPLSDHITGLAPPQAQVSTFHELCVEHYRRTVGEPDFTVSGVFQQVEQHYIAAMEDSVPRLDVLIIDEGQDFAPEWVESLIGLLKEDGRLTLMEDEDQRLYEREGFELPDAVHLTCHDNFRSPTNICQTINAFRLASYPIETRSPYAGDAPEFLSCDGSPQETRTQTILAVERLLKHGFHIKDITILTGHGARQSVLLNQDTLGQYSLHRFTGRYTRDGAPIWTNGDLCIESIYRFKGQSSPAIILSEIDFIEFNERERRKLFVGLTRAQMAVIVVLSEVSAKSLEQVLR